MRDEIFFISIFVFLSFFLITLLSVHVFKIKDSKVEEATEEVIEHFTGVQVDFSK